MKQEQNNKYAEYEFIRKTYFRMLCLAVFGFCFGIGNFIGLIILWTLLK